MREDAAGEGGLDQFRRRCREQGLALTHQREVIYEALLRMEGHPSPEAIYERVRRRIPSISLGTVYKNIRTFLDTGLVREVSPHRGTLRLETNLDPHHHLICTECRSIVDLNEEDVEPLRLRRLPPQGFQVRRLRLEVYGLCADCATKRGKPGSTA